MRNEIINKKIGEQITIAKPIGRGRLGAVFAGVHPVLARRFAVKILSKRYTRDENIMRRLRRMMREASTVQHIAVVPLLDFGIFEEERVYFTMDYIRGIQLTKVLERDGRFEPKRALQLLMQLADALCAAHRARVVHGDVKPNNILIFEEHDDSEALRIYDFKLLQALAPDPTEADPEAHLKLQSTFDYLAPELITEGHVDVATDIYAFGAVAYRMLSGEAPFFGTPEEVLAGHKHRDPVPPSRRVGGGGVAPALDDVILQCLEKRPRDRFHTMDEVIRALRDISPSRPVERPHSEEPTGRWDIAPQPEAPEPTLPDSPARLRKLFYETVLGTAELVVTEGAASDDMQYALTALRRIREEVAAVSAQSAVTENRFEDVRRELRERESTLRYAIIDLNLAKADMQERRATEREVRDVEFQIRELETSLTQLEVQRSERFTTLNEQLQSNRERLKALEHDLATCYRRLYSHLDETREKVSSTEGRKLYRLLERCRDALSKAAVG